MIKTRFMLSFVILVIAVVFTKTVVAQCLSLKLAKTSYLPQETLQLEIDADVIKDITPGDIFLYRAESKLPINIFISKISSTKYFVWFDLPQIPGNYIIKVRGNCKGGMHVAEIKFDIEPTIASKYKQLSALLENKFSLLSLEEHLLAAIALTNEKIAQQALNSYIERRDSCLNTGCNTKLNALTLMAFKYGLFEQKMLDAVEASQNYVEKGIWKLKIYSDVSQECNISVNNESIILAVTPGINVFDWNFNTTTKTILVKVNCNASAKLNYTYKTFSKEFNFSEITLNNQGCFSKDFTKVFESCDKEATFYALLALAKSNKFDNSSHLLAVSWLDKNGNGVEDKALVYFFSKDESLLSWLLNVQTREGWWPKENLYEPSVMATSIAAFVLKNIEAENINLENAINKAEKWLIEEFDRASIKDKATILAFAFSSKDIEPILAIWPGIIKTASSKHFDLILQNNGDKDITANAYIALLNYSAQIGLTNNSRKTLKFNVPLITTIDGRALLETMSLEYKTKISDKIYIYHIPLIIFTEKSYQDQINGSINATEKIINETELQEIINKSKEENKTAEINQSLLVFFRFIEKTISKNVTLGEPFSITVRLSNKMDKELRNIDLDYDSIFIWVNLNITPSNIKILKKNETKTIKLSFLPQSPGNFIGNIWAKAEYNGQKINTSLLLNITVAGTPAEEKNCSEMGGKICTGKNERCDGTMATSKDSNYCCIPAEKCVKTTAPGTKIGLIIVGIVVVILIAILYLIKKKSKKEMKQFLEETAKMYEKRFQRPLSIK